MAIFVDEIRAYPQKPKPGGQRYFGNGKKSCHMTTDGSLEELCLFAEKIGLQRRWLQGYPTHTHFDLTPAKRKLAVQCGAIEQGIMVRARKLFGEESA